MPIDLIRPRLLRGQFYLTRLMMLLALTLLVAVSVNAHPALPSQLAFIVDDADSAAPSISRFVLTMPVDQLHLAEQSLPIEVDALNAEVQQQYLAYLQQHIRLYAAADEQTLMRWQARDWRLDRSMQQDFGTNLLQVLITSPQPLSRDAVLDVDTLVHRVVNHRTLVSLFAAGTDTIEGAAAGYQSLLTASPTEAGSRWQQWLRRKHTTIAMSDIFDALQQHQSAALVTPSMSAWQYISYGFEHIAYGPDHLMFMFCLLLPAPLWLLAAAANAGRGHWRQLRPLVLQVSCFTFGHMASLLLAAAGIMLLPVLWTEVAVALTIAFTALLAMRASAVAPSASGYLVILIFGLIHGSAFAEILQHMNQQGWSLVLSLLAFNAGVEMMQLLLVVAVLPVFYILARHSPRLFRSLQFGLAAFILLVACGWVLQRLDWLALGWSDLLDDLSAQLPALLLLLWSVAAAFLVGDLLARFKPGRGVGQPG